MFYGANRPGAKVSRGMMDQFWLWSMQGGLLNIYDSIKAFFETDFTEDLKNFDVPTLVMHGEDDQVVPIAISSKKSAKLIKSLRLRTLLGSLQPLRARRLPRGNSTRSSSVECREHFSCRQT
jgi:pimeloyl-ACP methyl ester carboxylesterase